MSLINDNYLNVLQATCFNLLLELFEIPQRPDFPVIKPELLFIHIPAGVFFSGITHDARRTDNHSPFLQFMADGTGNDRFTQTYHISQDDAIIFFNYAQCLSDGIKLVFIGYVAIFLKKIFQRLPDLFFIKRVKISL